MREICHLQAGQCGNQIGAKVIYNIILCEMNHNMITSVRYLTNHVFMIVAISQNV